MATHDYVIANQSGAAFRTDLNNALAAIVSNNSNSSEPATMYAYQWWADTSAGVLKIRNSSNNGWVELLQLDGTLTMEDGSASTPGLAFRDDLNTGIFSSAADTFDIATAGVSRFQIDSSEITFNESGADTDFRVEGDSSTHLLFLDAGNDRVGIKASSPATPLHVGGDIHTTTSVVIRTTSSTNNLHVHQDDSDKSIAQFTNTATGSAAGDGFQIGLSSDEKALLNMKESASMEFKTADTTAMTIDSSQRLLLGTSSVSTACIFTVDGNMAMKNSSTGTGNQVKTFVLSRDYTMSTSAVQVLRLDNFGTSGFEISAFRRDTASPHGMELQKLYIGVQGSGSNMTDASMATETKFTKGSIHNVTFSVADNNNFVTLSATGDDNGGEAQSLTFYIIATGGSDGECTIV